jgi:hypothetical protein
MKTRSAFLFFCFALFALNSCTKESTVTPAASANIFGVIVDTAGNPVARAVIQSSPPSSQIFSASDGTYKLFDVIPGLYTITAQKAGVGSGSATITAANGKTIEANIILTPDPVTTGTITGKVVDSAGNGVTGAAISTIPITTDLTSDAQGNFIFTNVKAGQYTITVQKTGFAKGSKQATVTAAKITPVTIQLGLEEAFPAEGLVAYYPLNGDGTDASGNGHTLTIENGSFITSRKGTTQALLFDGTSTEAFATHDAAMNVAAITISLWIKMARPVVPSGSGMGIVGKYISSSYNGYTVFFSPDNMEWFYAGSPNSYTYCSTNFNAITDDTWHSLILTADNSGTKIFFDGTSVSSGGWTGTPSVPTQTNEFEAGFGKDNQGNILRPFFKGALSDIRIYDRVLNTKQIHDLANDK